MTITAAQGRRKGWSAGMLSDFGGFPPGEPETLHRIGDLAHLQRVVSDCCAQGRPMRVRCFGHSMNGMAVPSPAETLLDLSGVRHVTWNGAGSITAGAGLSIWELDQYVRRFGWKLPVINDGGAEAPSVGGFVAAGGIGQGSMFHGGFWESVSRLSLVTPDGQSQKVERDDPLFPWLFGSLGTLGVVYEAVLDLEPAGAARPRSVKTLTALPKGPAATWPPHMWLTLFVTEDQHDEAISRLEELVENHPQVWSTRGLYEYFMLYRRFNPPLVFGRNADFIALGIWGDRVTEDADLRQYQAMEADFQTLVEANGYRRYFQSELIRERRGLDRYVGLDCAAAYRDVKAACDPAGLLNRFMPAR